MKRKLLLGIIIVVAIGGVGRELGELRRICETSGHRQPCLVHDSLTDALDVIG